MLLYSNREYVFVSFLLYVCVCVCGVRALRQNPNNN